MTNYAIHFLSPDAPARRNVAMRSALLTGMLWRGALISGGAFPSFEARPRITLPGWHSRPELDLLHAWRTLRSRARARFTRLRRPHLASA